jgi:hypothetical protein
LVNLTIEENSFIREYRVTPEGFNILVQLLGSLLDFDQRKAQNAMSFCRSDMITVGSRIAAALIMLAGGRYVEVMRTHGMSK